jgi:hypothetical protein
LIDCDENFVLNIPNCESIITVHSSQILGEIQTGYDSLEITKQYDSIEPLAPGEQENGIFRY